MENGPRETLGELANRLADLENTENGQDDRMYLAINQFVGTREQSYEQFLDGFTQLTMDNVLKRKENYINEDNDMDVLTPNWSTQSHNGEKTAKGHEFEDDLEVELLEEGSKNRCVAESSKPSGRSLVKFDNFVEDEPILDDIIFPEDSDLNDILMDSCYTASFHDTSTRVTTLPDSGVEDDSCCAKVSCEKKIKEFDTEINFGEVDDIIETDAMHSFENQTCLELKTTDLLPHNTTQEVHKITNEVQEFHLDPNYDYDNVRLTPKFSEDDIRIIMASADLSH